MATSILALSACSEKEGSASKVIVSTKAGDITQDELYEEMKDSIGPDALENLILLRAIQNEYDVKDSEIKDAIESRKEQYGDSFELYLAQNKLTESSFEKRVTFQLYQEKMIDTLDDITEEEIKAAYELKKKEIHAQHILVQDKKTADEVIAKLKDGSDFSELAREYSTEPIAQETGGDLGWFGVGKMVIPFEEAAFQLAVNEISEPIQTIHGFHVIEVIETRAKELDKTIDELKPDIEDELKARLFEEKLVVLLNNADVDIKVDEFKSVLKGYLPTAESK